MADDTAVAGETIGLGVRDPTNPGHIAAMRPLSTRRGLSGWLPIGLASLLGVLVIAAIVAMAIALGSDGNKITSLQREVRQQAQALGQDSAATSLQTQVSGLNSLTLGLQNSLNTVSNNVRQLQTSVGTICNPSKVSNEESNLNGEATAEGYNQYFLDLQNVLTAICQPSS